MGLSNDVFSIGLRRCATFLPLIGSMVFLPIADSGCHAQVSPAVGSWQFRQPWTPYPHPIASRMLFIKDRKLPAKTQARETKNDFCTTREASVLLGLSLGKVQQMAESGELKAWKTSGGHRRVSLRSVEENLRQRGTGIILKTSVEPRRHRGHRGKTSACRVSCTHPWGDWYRIGKPLIP